MANKTAAAQEVFARYEKKYLLTSEQYEGLRAGLAERMEPDRYGQYTICNIYFDTGDYSLIRRSLEKPVYKEKLRLRSYGAPQEDDTVFLELKKKYDGIVYKRRAPMTLGEARRYLAGEGGSPRTQIMREIDWFMDFYRPQPKVYIAYDRCALCGREDPDLRVTFDRAIRWRDSALDLGRGDWGSPLTDPRSVLMEVKIPDAMPLWMCHLFNGLHCYPTSFSKYGCCYSRYLSRDWGKGGVLCA